MKNINLISSVEAHLLVDKAILSTLNSLKESPLNSIREAAKYWEQKLSGSSVHQSIRDSSNDGLEDNASDVAI